MLSTLNLMRTGRQLHYIHTGPVTYCVILFGKVDQNYYEEWTSYGSDTLHPLNVRQRTKNECKQRSNIDQQYTKRLFILRWLKKKDVLKENKTIVKPTWKRFQWFRPFSLFFLYYGIYSWYYYFFVTFLYFVYVYMKGDCLLFLDLMKEITSEEQERNDMIVMIFMIYFNEDRNEQTVNKKI